MYGERGAPHHRSAEPTREVMAIAQRAAAAAAAQQAAVAVVEHGETCQQALIRMGLLITRPGRLLTREQKTQCRLRPSPGEPCRSRAKPTKPFCCKKHQTQVFYTPDGRSSYRCCYDCKTFKWTSAFPNERGRPGRVCNECVSARASAASGGTPRKEGAFLEKGTFKPGTRIGGGVDDEPSDDESPLGHDALAAPRREPLSRDGSRGPVIPMHIGAGDSSDSGSGDDPDNSLNASHFMGPRMPLAHSASASAMLGGSLNDSSPLGAAAAAASDKPSTIEPSSCTIDSREPGGMSVRKVRIYGGLLHSYMSRITQRPVVEFFAPTFIGHGRNPGVYYPDFLEVDLPGPPNMMGRSKLEVTVYLKSSTTGEKLDGGRATFTYVMRGALSLSPASSQQMHEGASTGAAGEWPGVVREPTRHAGSVSASDLSADGPTAPDALRNVSGIEWSTPRRVGLVYHDHGSRISAFNVHFCLCQHSSSSAAALEPSSIIATMRNFSNTTLDDIRARFVRGDVAPAASSAGGSATDAAARQQVLNEFMSDDSRWHFRFWERGTGAWSEATPIRREAHVQIDRGNGSRTVMLGLCNPQHRTHPRVSTRSPTVSPTAAETAERALDDSGASPLAASAKKAPAAAAPTLRQRAVQAFSTGKLLRAVAVHDPTTLSTIASASHAVAGWTPLHAAAAGNDADAVLLLVALGADVSARSVPEGDTPLHLALEAGKPQSARPVNTKRGFSLPGAHTTFGAAVMLLQLGADVLLRNNDGLSAIDVMHDAGFNGMATMLTSLAGDGEDADSRIESVVASRELFGAMHEIPSMASIRSASTVSHDSGFVARLWLRYHSQTVVPSWKLWESDTQRSSSGRSPHLSPQRIGYSGAASPQFGAHLGLSHVGLPPRTPAAGATSAGTGVGPRVGRGAGFDRSPSAPIPRPDSGDGARRNAYAAGGSGSAVLNTAERGGGDQHKASRLNSAAAALAADNMAMGMGGMAVSGLEPQSMLRALLCGAMVRAMEIDSPRNGWQGLAAILLRHAARSAQLDRASMGVPGRPGTKRRGQATLVTAALCKFIKAVRRMEGSLSSSAGGGGAVAAASRRPEEPPPVEEVAAGGAGAPDARSASAAPASRASGSTVSSLLQDSRSSRSSSSLLSDELADGVVRERRWSVSATNPMLRAACADATAMLTVESVHQRAMRTQRRLHALSTYYPFLEQNLMRLVAGMALEEIHTGLSKGRYSTSDLVRAFGTDDLEELLVDNLIQAPAGSVAELLVCDAAAHALGASVQVVSASPLLSSDQQEFARAAEARELGDASEGNMMSMQLARQRMTAAASLGAPWARVAASGPDGSTVMCFGPALITTTSAPGEPTRVALHANQHRQFAVLHPRQTLGVLRPASDPSEVTRAHRPELIRAGGRPQVVFTPAFKTTAPPVALLAHVTSAKLTVNESAPLLFVASRWLERNEVLTLRSVCRRWRENIGGIDISVERPAEDRDASIGSSTSSSGFGTRPGAAERLTWRFGAWVSSDGTVASAPAAAATSPSASPVPAGEDSPRQSPPTGETSAAVSIAEANAGASESKGGEQFSGLSAVPSGFLTLQRPRGSLGDTAFLSALGTFSNSCLRSLDLSGCKGLGPAAICAIADHPNLRRLVLRNCAAVTDQALQALAKARGGRDSTITHVDMSGCIAVTDAGIASLCKVVGSLTTAKFRGCIQLTDGALQPLAAVGSTLVTLDISDCPRITEDGLRAIASHCPALSRLFASRTGVRHVPVLVGWLRRLYQLDLSGQRIVVPSNEVVRHGTRALLSNLVNDGPTPCRLLQVVVLGDRTADKGPLLSSLLDPVNMASATRESALGGELRGDDGDLLPPIALHIWDATRDDDAAKRVHAKLWQAQHLVFLAFIDLQSWPARGRHVVRSILRFLSRNVPGARVQFIGANLDRIGTSAGVEYLEQLNEIVKQWEGVQSAAAERQRERSASSSGARSLIDPLSRRLVQASSGGSSTSPDLSVRILGAGAVSLARAPALLLDRQGEGAVRGTPSVEGRVALARIVTQIAYFEMGERMGVPMRLSVEELGRLLLRRKHAALAGTIDSAAAVQDDSLTASTITAYRQRRRPHAVPAGPSSASMTTMVAREGWYALGFKFSNDRFVRYEEFAGEVRRQVGIVDEVVLADAVHFLHQAGLVWCIRGSMFDPTADADDMAALEQFVFTDPAWLARVVSMLTAPPVLAEARTMLDTGVGPGVTGGAGGVAASPQAARFSFVPCIEAPRRRASTSSATRSTGSAELLVRTRDYSSGKLPHVTDDEKYNCLYGAYVLSSLSLSVTSWRFAESAGKQYVEFEIMVNAADELGNPHEWSVFHRFSSFRELHKQLKPYARLTKSPLFERGTSAFEVPSPALTALLGASGRSPRRTAPEFPDLPDAHMLFKTRDDHFRTERQVALDRYVRQLVEQGPAVSRCSPLLDFIEAGKQPWILPLRAPAGLLADIAVYHEGGLLSRTLIQKLLSRLEPAAQAALLSVMTHTGLAIPVGRPSTTRHASFRGSLYSASDQRTSFSSMDSSLHASASERESTAILSAGESARAVIDVAGSALREGGPDSSPSASGAATGHRSGGSEGRGATYKPAHFLVPSMIAPVCKKQDSALAASWASGDGSAPRMGRLFELASCPPHLFERLISRWLQRRCEVLSMCYREECLVIELPVAHGSGDDREVVMVMANLSLEVAVNDAAANAAPIGGDPVLDARARARAGMGMGSDSNLSLSSGYGEPVASVMVLAWMEESSTASRLGIGGHFAEPSWFGFLSMIDSCRRIFDEVITEEWVVFKYGSQLLQLSKGDALANSGWYNGTNVLPLEEVEQHSDTPRMVAEFFLTERQRAWRRGSDASMYDMRAESTELPGAALRDGGTDRFHLVRLK